MQVVLSVGELDWEKTYKNQLGKGQLPATFTLAISLAVCSTTLSI